MRVPSPHDEPEAYVPGWSDEPDEEERPVDRAAVIEDARRARIEEGGLPVDDATLERVADAVMHPDYELPGLFFTWEECYAEVPDDVADAVGRYLEERPEANGGLSSGWRDGKPVLFAGVVGDPAPHERALADIAGDWVVVQQAPRTVAELDALAERIVEDHDGLRSVGFDLSLVGTHPSEGVVEVGVIGGSEGTAARAFTERYGAAVRVDWLGPSSEREVPHPFGSWTSDGSRLVVFFGVDHNGQRLASASVVAEEPERIVVAVRRFEPVGLTHLVGGFKPQQAELDLAQPVGDRTLIDASTGEERPAADALGAG